MANQRPFRCRLGMHRWRLPLILDVGWTCVRCGKRPAVCSNCGGRHDPTATLVICTVRRG